MLKFRSYKTEAAAKKAANGTPYVRLAGRYFAAPRATPKDFATQRLVVLYSPTGRIVKSFNMSAAMKRREREQRIELIARLLRRKRGTTREEVKGRTGWRAVSMQAMAREAGLRLTKRGTNPVRYFGARR
jgi:hypothetical protein